MPNIIGDTNDPQTPAVLGNVSNDTDEAGPGVKGISKGTGVWGESRTWMGVYGHTLSTTGGAGVMGEAVGPGVIGKSQTGHAVYGETQSTTGGAGVWGQAVGPGVVGVSQTWHGAYGETQSTTGGAGVWGEHKGGGSGVVGVSESGAGVYGKGGRVAGFFDGDVEVTGDLILTGADYAEALTTTDPDVAPGLVVVLGEDGEVHPCTSDYDTAVAGIVSGAGGVRPALVLDRHENSAHVALMGKVWCMADADAAPIRPGDLLTTSSVPGHCRRVTEPGKAFGAVIGKALTPLSSGQGLVRVLVSPR